MEFFIYWLAFVMFFIFEIHVIINLREINQSLSKIAKKAEK